MCVIAGYAINSQSTHGIDLTFDRKIIDTQSENIISFRHYDIRFTPDGNALLTLTDQGISKNIFNQYGGKQTIHHCVMSKTTTNNGLVLTQS